MNPLSPVLAFANRLRFRNLFILTLILFVFDMLVPDFLPLIDEIMLGLLSILFASWKNQRPPVEPDNVIEGEVVDPDKD